MKFYQAVLQRRFLKKSKETDLIVIGSKGRSYTEAVIIGSVAEAVIKNSSTPVLLVH